MKKVNKIYCVMIENGDIMGRFINKKHAIDYMMNCYFDGYEVIIKTMTPKEYLKYTKKLIDNTKQK